MSEPRQLDQLDVLCHVEKMAIRRAFRERIREVRRWRLASCPDDWRPSDSMP